MNDFIFVSLKAIRKIEFNYMLKSGIEIEEHIFRNKASELYWGDCNFIIPIYELKQLQYSSDGDFYPGDLHKITKIQNEGYNFIELSRPNFYKMTPGQYYIKGVNN